MATLKVSPEALPEDPVALKTLLRAARAERVRTVIGQDPFAGHGFIFRSRRGDRLKILTWDQDGFILWYKRLEAGVFKLPRAENGARSWELRASELAMILDGIDVSRLERVRRYQRPGG